MESVSLVSPSVVLPPSNPYQRRSAIITTTRTNRCTKAKANLSSFFNRRRSRTRDIPTCCRRAEGEGEAADEEEKHEEDLERAIHLDGSIPGTSDEFVKRVSSRAYDMRRHLQQSFDSSSYDVLEANPWREASKPVYVLTHRENLLCTMKTRRNRSEVERELGLLFSKGENWRSKLENKTKQSRNGTKFRMLVEDVREGVLVFEDENDAAKYCDLLNGGGQGCEGVAEIEASSVFDICRRMRALAVLFRRGGIPPEPENLELNLKARKRSLEDQEDLI